MDQVSGKNTRVCKKGSMVLVAMLVCYAQMVQGSLSWPADRLLPEFSTPAPGLDCIDVSSASPAEVSLFASLEGIVNRTQPRIACVNDKFPEGKFRWLKLHKLTYRLTDGYADIVKYRAELNGLVVTDPRQPATLNLATTMAGLQDELICAPNLLPTLTNAPYNLAVKDDLRGRFENKYQVYQYLYTNCWPECTHRVIAGMGPGLHGGLRDYLVAVKSAVLWLNPRSPADAAALAPFLSDMRPLHGVFMGWWPDEAAGLKWIGQYGIPVLASDAFANASVYGGVVEPICAPAVPTPSPLQNKVYVSIFLSDGDNVQYMQHRMKDNWDSPSRGSVPIGWTVSPLAVDLDPGMLNYYWSRATTNDCLVSGPSGAGYARLDFWNGAYLNEFTKATDPYLRRSGIQIITIWLRATATIEDSFAANCPSLFGIISFQGGSFARIHDGLPVIGLVAKANYSRSVQEIKDSIVKAAKNWDGTRPLFIAVQGDGWDISPEDCRSIADSLDRDEFVVVRPDQLFQLYRQSAGQSALKCDPQGWTGILPSPMLAGWTRIAIPATHPLGRAQWHLDDTGHILICDGDGGHEMLRYDRELSNCIFHVEFRFTPTPGAKGKYNSGVFIRTSADGSIWHQAQVASVGGFLFGDTPVDGKLKRIKVPLKENRMKPAGEWNTMEVTARGKTLTVWLNGAVTSEFSNCEVPNGYIALEAEGHRIEFRNLKLKEIGR